MQHQRKPQANAPETTVPPGATHVVTNQPPPLEGYDLFSVDPVLGDALERAGAGWARERAIALGTLLGGAPLEWGRLANVHTPILRTHDRYGHRIDEVEFHPAWHDLMRTSVAHEVHALPWRTPRPGAHAARAALFYCTTQVEAGHLCPISMTYSGVPALRAQPEVAAEWEPRLTSTAYDARMRPAVEKTGALCGMAMTEKQGGSDVRANTTRAVAMGASGPGREYAITGHKWFCSAPMCDVFLVLAQTERGLSCFALPRWLPDGTRNRIHIQRLKDKLGNRSNASSEVEFHEAWARMVGEEGRGVPTIIEMVNHTRLDCTIGSAAGMRAALVQAIHHAHHRTTFGKRLADHALMQNVLADLAVEVEAATITMMRLAQAYDDGAATEEQAFARLATAASKYWVCKRQPVVVAEALECLGGAGYVEESVLPRLFRESPLNGVWEGSGNVICLDVLRAMGREPESVTAFFAEVDRGRGHDRRLDAFVDALRTELTDFADVERRARRIVERLALALQGSLLVRHGTPATTEAFLASRLDGDHGAALGTLPRGTDFGAIIERAFPA
jgi:putative acyl-CoA dehydrogenase